MATWFSGPSPRTACCWRSADGGRQWDTLGPAPYDIALNPRGSGQAVGTTESGPVVSDDSGKTWRPTSGAPGVALVAWTDDALWGVTPGGVVHFSVDAGTTWSMTGKVEGQPSALAADDDQVVILAGDTVWESLDHAAVFHPRITGMPGH